MPRKRLRASAWWLGMRQRLVTSWSSWCLKRTLRKTAKAERRLLLLQVETDRQLLQVKELLQRQEQLRHRHQEHQESLLFRQAQLKL